MVEIVGETERQLRPGTSGEMAKPKGQDQQHGRDPIPPTPQVRASQMVRDAEKAKERLLKIPGENNALNSESFKHDNCNEGNLLHSVIVDEEYTAIASHVDNALRRRIILGEYVDLVRLLPKDKVQVEEEQRMEIVNRGGMSFWVPINDRNSQSISNIAKWEESFHVYSRIYTEGNPSRAIELIQYSHIIHEAALEFPWESVYAYDKEFRVHLSKYPSRNWGIILQQAWTLKMRRNPNPNQSGRDANNGHQHNHGNICWKFNQGCCTYGVGCKFEHKCAICNKWGHGVVNYRCGRGDNRDRDHDYHHYHDNEMEEKSRYHRRDNRDDKKQDKNDRFHYYRKK